MFALDRNTRHLQHATVQGDLCYGSRAAFDGTSHRQVVVEEQSEAFATLD